MSKGIKRAVERLVWPVVGLALAVGLWSLGARQLSDVEAIRNAFAPTAGFAALGRLLAAGDLWEHIALSLQRIGLSLLLALLIAVPLGIWIGLSPLFAKLTGTLFQFLRMVSPLSWMPLAVMALGVGEAPVVFLLTFAAVWLWKGIWLSHQNSIFAKAIPMTLPISPRCSAALSPKCLTLRYWPIWTTSPVGPPATGEMRTN